MIKITMIEKTFERTLSGKSWRKNCIESQEKIISKEEYDNYISSMGFFRNLGGSERAYKNYTCCGYIVTRLISVDPSNSIKIERNFKFEYIR